MKNRARSLAHAAVIAALYAVLTHMQNILLPNSTSFAIQFRMAEALCVLAFFTPAAISGLTIGCLVYNLCRSPAPGLAGGQPCPLPGSLVHASAPQSSPAGTADARPDQCHPGGLGADRVYRRRVFGQCPVCGHRRGGGAADPWQHSFLCDPHPAPGFPPFWINITLTSTAVFSAVPVLVSPNKLW